MGGTVSTYAEKYSKGSYSLEPRKCGNLKKKRRCPVGESSTSHVAPMIVPQYRNLCLTFKEKPASRFTKKSPFLPGGSMESSTVIGFVKLADHVEILVHLTSQCTSPCKGTQKTFYENFNTCIIFIQCVLGPSFDSNLYHGCNILTNQIAV